MLPIHRLAPSPLHPSTLYPPFVWWINPFFPFFYPFLLPFLLYSPFVFLFLLEQQIVTITVTFLLLCLN